jgi:hypothetical protein
MGKCWRTVSHSLTVALEVQSEVSQGQRTNRASCAGNPLFCIVSKKIGLAFDLSAFTCDPGSPRTDVLGHSQPSLRDFSFALSKPRTDVLGYTQPELSKLAGRYGFSACILWKRLRRVRAYEIKLPEDFRSTHPSATTLPGSADPHFVIPSAAEGPAVRLDAKQRPSLLRHCTPGKLLRTIKPLG